MPSIPPIRPDAADNTAEMRAAIRQASAKTGVPFQYLVAQAEQESGLTPNARAKTSSAAGLYQFTEGTWLRMMREHGQKHGQADLSKALAAGPDASTRAQALALRDDPRLSATMAAEYARANHSQLTQSLGRDIGAADLYFAHFLGANGATKFLRALGSEPSRPAADLLPEAAGANPNVFYDASGASRSVRDIYGRFAAKFDPGAIAMTSGPSPASADEGFGDTRQLETVIRRMAIAAISGNVLSPTVIAALAGLDVPETSVASKTRSF